MTRRRSSEYVSGIASARKQLASSVRSDRIGDLTKERNNKRFRSQKASNSASSLHNRQRSRCLALNGLERPGSDCTDRSMQHS
jgi:hypothetical protein